MNEIASPAFAVVRSTLIVAAGSLIRSVISLEKVWPSLVLKVNFTGKSPDVAKIWRSAPGRPLYFRVFPFPKSQFVSRIRPFPIAREAVASKINPCAAIVGEIFISLILLTLIPFTRSVISPSFGCT